MKKIFFLSAAMLISTVLFAQNPAISTKHSNEEIATLIQNYNNSRQRDAFPTVDLQQKFLQDFPNARDVEWETNGELYEVEFEIRHRFEMRRRDFTAFYDKEGNLLMYRQQIRASELPAIVKTAAEARFPKFRFEDIEKIRIGTQTLYEIEMERRDSEVKMLISSDGRFIDSKFDY
jgi:hypothetical protein